LKIYTIGYGNDLGFADRIPEEVELVIDVRRDCTGWCKPLDTPLRSMDVDKVKSIKSLMPDSIKYIHIPSLGNNCRSLDEYAEWLKKHSSDMRMLCCYIRNVLYDHRAICLLCCEKEAMKDGTINCHRVHIAERIKAYDELQGFTSPIVHL